MRWSIGWCTVRLLAPSRLPFILFGSTTYNSFPILRQERITDGTHPDNSHSTVTTTKNSANNNSNNSGGMTSSRRKEFDLKHTEEGTLVSPPMTFQHVAHLLHTLQPATSSLPAKQTSEDRRAAAAAAGSVKTNKTAGFQALLLWCALYQEHSRTHPTSSTDETRVRCAPLDGLFSSTTGRMKEVKHERSNTHSTVPNDPLSSTFTDSQKCATARTHKGGEGFAHDTREARGSSSHDAVNASFTAQEEKLLSSRREANDAALGWIQQHMDSFSCGQSLILLSLVCDLLYRGLCSLPLSSDSSWETVGEREKKKKKKKKGLHHPHPSVSGFASTSCREGGNHVLSHAAASTSCPTPSSFSSFSLSDRSDLHDFVSRLRDTILALLRHVQHQPIVKLEAQSLPLLASGMYAVFRVREKLHPRPPPFGSASSLLSSLGDDAALVNALHEPLALLQRVFALRIRPPPPYGHLPLSSPLASMIIANPSLAIKVMLTFFLCVPPDVRRAIWQEREPSAVRSLSILLLRTLQPWLHLRERKRQHQKGEEEEEEGEREGGEERAGVEEEKRRQRKNTNMEHQAEGSPSVVATAGSAKGEATPHTSAPASPSGGTRKTTTTTMAIRTPETAVGEHGPEKSTVSEEEDEKEMDDGPLHTQEYLQECQKIFSHMWDHAEIRSFLHLCLLEYLLLRVRHPASYTPSELAFFPLLLRPFRVIPSQYRHNIVKELMRTSRLLPDERASHGGEANATARSSIADVGHSCASGSIASHRKDLPQPQDVPFVSVLIRLLPLLYFPKDVIEQSGILQWSAAAQAVAVATISCGESAEILHHTASYLPPAMQVQLHWNILQDAASRPYLESYEEDGGKETTSAPHLAKQKKKKNKNKKRPPPIPSTITTIIHRNGTTTTIPPHTDGMSAPSLHASASTRPLTIPLVYALHHLFFHTSSSSSFTSSSSSSSSLHPSSVLAGVREQLQHPEVLPMFATAPPRGMAATSSPTLDSRETVKMETSEAPRLLDAYTRLLLTTGWEEGVEEIVAMGGGCRSLPSAALPDQRQAWERHDRALCIDADTATVHYPSVEALVSSASPSTLYLPPDAPASAPPPSFSSSSSSSRAWWTFSPVEEAQLLRMALEVYLYLQDTPLYDHCHTRALPSTAMPPVVLPPPVLSDLAFLEHYLYPLLAPPCRSPLSATASHLHADSEAAAHYCTHSTLCTIFALVARAVPLLTSPTHAVSLLQRAVQFNDACPHISRRGKTRLGYPMMRFLQYLAPLATVHTMIAPSALASLTDPSILSLDPLRVYTRNHWGTGENGWRGWTQTYTAVVLAACEYYAMVISCGTGGECIPSSSFASSAVRRWGTEGGKEQLAHQVEGWLERYFRHVFHVAYQLRALEKTSSAIAMASPQEEAHQEDIAVSPSPSPPKEEEVEDAEKQGIEEEEVEEDEEAESLPSEWCPSEEGTPHEGEREIPACTGEERAIGGGGPLSSSTASSLLPPEKETVVRDEIGEGQHALLSAEDANRLFTAALRLGVHLPSSVYHRMIQQPMHRLAVLPPSHPVFGVSDASATTTTTTMDDEDDHAADGEEKWPEASVREGKAKGTAASGAAGEPRVPAFSLLPSSRATSSESLAGRTANVDAPRRIHPSLPSPAHFVYFVRSGQPVSFPLTTPYLSFLLSTCDMHIFHLTLSAFILALHAPLAGDRSGRSSPSSSLPKGKAERCAHRLGHTTSPSLSSFSSSSTTTITPWQWQGDTRLHSRAREARRTAVAVLPSATRVLAKRLFPSSPASFSGEGVVTAFAKSVIVMNVLRVLLHHMDRVVALLAAHPEESLLVEMTTPMPATGEEAEPSWPPLGPSSTTIASTLTPSSSSSSPPLLSSACPLPSHMIAPMEMVFFRCVEEWVEASHVKKMCFAFLDKLYVYFPSVAALLFQKLIHHEGDTLTVKELFTLSIAAPITVPFILSQLDRKDMTHDVELSDFLPHVKQLPMAIVERVLHPRVSTLSFAWCSRLLSSLSSRQQDIPFPLLEALLTQLESLVPTSSDSDRHLMLMVLQGYFVPPASPSSVTAPQKHSLSCATPWQTNGSATSAVTDEGEKATTPRVETDPTTPTIPETEDRKQERVDGANEPTCPSPSSSAPTMDSSGMHQRLLQCYATVMKVRSVVDVTTLKEFLRLTPSSLHSYILPTLLDRVQHCVLPSVLSVSSSSTTAHSASSLPTLFASLQDLLRVTRLLHQETLLSAAIRQHIAQAVFPIDPSVPARLHLTRRASASLGAPTEEGHAPPPPPPLPATVEEEGGVPYRTETPGGIPIVPSSSSPPPPVVGNNENPLHAPVLGKDPSAASAPPPSTTTTTTTLSSSTDTFASPSPSVVTAVGSVEEWIALWVELALLLGDRYAAVPPGLLAVDSWIGPTTDTTATPSPPSIAAASWGAISIAESTRGTDAAVPSTVSLLLHLSQCFPSTAHRLHLLTTVADVASGWGGGVGNGGGTSSYTSSCHATGSTGHRLYGSTAAGMTSSTSSSLPSTGVGRYALSLSPRPAHRRATSTVTSCAGDAAPLSASSAGGGGDGITDALDVLTQQLLQQHCGELSSARFVKFILFVSKTKRWHLLPADAAPPASEKEASSHTTACRASTVCSPYSFHRVFAKFFHQADAHTRCVLMRALSTDAALLDRYAACTVPPLLESIHVLSYEDLELLLTMMLPMHNMTFVEDLLDAIGTRVLALLPMQCRMSTFVRLLQCHARFRIDDDPLLTRVLWALTDSISYASPAFKPMDTTSSSSGFLGGGRGTNGGGVGSGGSHGQSPTVPELRLSVPQIIHLLQSIVKLELRAPEALLRACFARVEKMVETVPPHHVVQLARLAVEMEMEYSPSIHALVTSLLDHNHRASDYRTTEEEKETVDLLCDFYDVELPFQWRRLKVRDRRRMHRQMEAKFYLEQKMEVESTLS